VGAIPRFLLISWLAGGRLGRLIDHHKEEEGIGADAAAGDRVPALDYPRCTRQSLVRHFAVMPPKLAANSGARGLGGPGAYVPWRSSSYPLIDFHLVFQFHLWTGIAGMFRSCPFGATYMGSR
jgi:hypothetical protein